MANSDNNSLLNQRRTSLSDLLAAHEETPWSEDVIVNDRNRVRVIYNQPADPLLSAASRQYYAVVRPVRSASAPPNFFLLGTYLTKELSQSADALFLPARRLPYEHCVALKTGDRVSLMLFSRSAAKFSGFNIASQITGSSPSSTSLALNPVTVH